MPPTVKSKGVKHVVQISTNIEKPCEHCSSLPIRADFAESINHYIEKHGYKLLHAGTETIHDMNGHPWHTSAALLGK